MHRLPTRRLFVAFATTLLVACGGGEGGAESPSPLPETPPPTGGTPPPAGYTAAQRGESTARIAIQYERLVAAKDPTPWDTLRAWTLTQPEFTEAGVGENLLWARFSDGRMFVYVDNWKPVTMPAQPQAVTAGPPAAFTTPAALPAKRTLAAAAAAPQPEVPKSARAVFLRQGAEEFGYATGLIQRMRSMMSARGWQTEDGSMDVASLKNLKGHGFVFLTSHAAPYGPDGHKRYSMLTDTMSSDDFEAAYKPDLDDGALVYGRDRTWMIRNFGHEYALWGRSYPRYAATDTFVRKYMNFADDALVVLMMCNSGSPESAAMRAAFLDPAVNAGSLMVWNGSANAMGYPAVEALVDRMTGSNRPVVRYGGVLNPPAVPQRAFERADVETFLNKVGLLDQPAVEGSGTTRIRFEGARVPLLNPVLASLRATGKDKLILNGRFGTRRQPTITIGGHPVAVDRWDTVEGKEIEVTLPTGPSDPPGSKGEVIVTVDSRSSNPRVLGSWRGEVEYVIEEIYGAEPDVFRNRTLLKLHLRADAHALRTEVDGPLLDNPYLISMASDTRWQWVAEGGCVSCHLFQSWSGQKSDLEVQYNIDASSPYPPDYANMVNPVFAAIQATSGQIQLYSGLGLRETFTVTSHHTPPRTNQATLSQPDQMLFTAPRPPGQVGGLAFGIALPFAWQQEIAAQKLEKLVPGTSNDSAPHRHTIRWGTIAASPAFDDRIGR